MRFHLVAALYVTAFCAKFYSLTSAQWALLILTIASVFICEIFNTVLERVCDMVKKEYDKNIEFIKDVSAGAVLVSAIGAIVVAFIILFRTDVFRYILNYFTHNIFALVALILGSALAVAFIAVKPEKYIVAFKKLTSKTKETKKD